MDGIGLSLSPNFYKEEQTHSIRLNLLEGVLRKKLTLIIAACLFLLAAAATVFFIYGVMASPTIAMWLRPINPVLLFVLISASIALAGFSSATMLISGYSFFNTEKYADNQNGTNNDGRNEPPSQNLIEFV